jgi:hypothetical protein
VEIENNTKAIEKELRGVKDELKAILRDIRDCLEKAENNRTDDAVKEAPLQTDVRQS